MEGLDRPNCCSQRMLDSVGRSMRIVSSEGRSSPSLKILMARIAPGDIAVVHLVGGAVVVEGVAPEAFEMGGAPERLDRGEEERGVGVVLLRKALRLLPLPPQTNRWRSSKLMPAFLRIECSVPLLSSLWSGTITEMFRSRL